jgi:low affinity Fe/Cu permease
MKRKANVLGIERAAGMFSRFAKWSSSAMGHPWAFTTAVLIILAWAVTGPMFQFSDTWQLIINTGTTIVTFLMVFVIQNTQNRDNGAVQLKIDELIRSNKGAHTALLDIEELTQEDLDRFRQLYEKLAREGRKKIREGLRDTGTPELDR